MPEALWIEGGPLTNIVIGQTGTAAVYQNIRCILSTMAGTVFLDRDFGLRFDVIDESMLVAMQRLRVEVVSKLAMYEPRVRVFRVQFVDPGIEEAARGTLVPRVLVRIREGVLL